MEYPFPSLQSCFQAERGHPCLFFDLDALSRLRRQCLHGERSGEYAALRQRVTLAAEGGGVPCSPPRDETRYGGNPEKWILADQEAVDLLSGAALVALVEDDPGLVETAWRFSSQRMAWPSWVHPQLPWHSVDLRSSYTMMTLAMVYDFLFDRLGDNRRIEIESICWWRGLCHLVENPDREAWASRYDSNWCAVCCAGVAATAVAFAAGGQQDSGRYLALADAYARRVWRYLDSYDQGGGWSEGQTYWGYGTGLAFTLAHVLRSATDGVVNLFIHPAMADIGEFPLRCFLPPEGAVNFGDSYSRPYVSPANLKLAQEQRDGRQLWLYQTRQADYQTNESAVLRVLWQPEDLQPVPPTYDPPSAHCPKIGWTIFRADRSDPDGLVVPVKIGSTASPHGHADVGTFLLHAGGKTFLREFGMPRYGDREAVARFRSTAAHNLPLFAGQGQQADRPRRGRILQCDLGGAEERLVADITEPYGMPSLRKFVRTFVFRPPDRLEIVDSFEVAEETPLLSFFHFSGEPALEPSGLALASGGWRVAFSVKTDLAFGLTLGRHENLVANLKESPTPISVPHLALDATLAPPGGTIQYSFAIGRAPA